MARKNLSVLFRKLVASESMLPDKLRRYLTSSDQQFINKPREFFARKLNDTKRQVAQM